MIIKIIPVALAHCFNQCTTDIAHLMITATSATKKKKKKKHKSIDFILG